MMDDIAAFIQIGAVLVTNMFVVILFVTKGRNNM